MKRKHKRLIFGRNWHGWSWKCGRHYVGFVEQREIPPSPWETPGEWVRMRLVEAEK